MRSLAIKPGQVMFNACININSLSFSQSGHRRCLDQPLLNLLLKIRTSNSLLRCTPPHAVKRFKYSNCIRKLIEIEINQVNLDYFHTNGARNDCANKMSRVINYDLNALSFNCFAAYKFKYFSFNFYQTIFFARYVSRGVKQLKLIPFLWLSCISI